MASAAASATLARRFDRAPPHATLEGAQAPHLRARRALRHRSAGASTARLAHGLTFQGQRNAPNRRDFLDKCSFSRELTGRVAAARNARVASPIGNEITPFGQGLGMTWFGGPSKIVITFEKIEHTPHRLAFWVDGSQSTGTGERVARIEAFIEHLPAAEGAERQVGCQSEGAYPFVGIALVGGEVLIDFPREWAVEIGL